VTSPSGPRSLMVGLLAAWVAGGCGSSAGGMPDAGRDADGGGTPDTGSKADSVGSSETGGNPDTGGNSETGQSLTLNQYPAAYAKAFCGRLFTCCFPADRAPQFGATEADCLSALENAAFGVTGDLGADVAKGYIAYDGARAAACFGAISATSCEVVQGAGDFTASIAACQDHFLPKVAPGGACLDNHDCIGGWCDATIGMKCVPALTDGQPCGTNNQCKEGSYCPNSGLCAPRPVRRFCLGG
jgi:hypothetical protein